MNQKIGLHLAYDGRNFQGYQIQPGQRTVQSELEKALQSVLGHPCPTLCAGRTDAGVHARAQFIHLETETHFPVSRLAAALRPHLPEDLLALQAFALPENFHARFSALTRRYRYFIKPQSKPDPFSFRYCWHYPYSVDLQKLIPLWNSLKGKYDFSAFCKSGSYRTQFEIEILDTKVTLLDSGLIYLEIEAQSFLYNMVRTLVGTVLDIVRGRFTEDHLTQLLQAPERAKTGLTAPPQGLFLWNVSYPSEFGLNLQDSAQENLGLEFLY